MLEYLIFVVIELFLMNFYKQIHIFYISLCASLRIRSKDLGINVYCINRIGNSFVHIFFILLFCFCCLLLLLFYLNYKARVVLEVFICFYFLLGFTYFYFIFLISFQFVGVVVFQCNVSNVVTFLNANTMFHSGLEMGQIVLSNNYS